MAAVTEQRTSRSAPAAGDYATVEEALPTPAASSDAADGAALETASASSLNVPPPERCSWPWLVWWLWYIWRKMFPPGFWRQLLDICKVSWKTVVSTLFQYFHLAVLTSVVVQEENIDEITLNAFNIAITLVYMFGFSLSMAITLPCDLLYATAVATGRRAVLGTLLVRCTLVLTLLTLPVFVVYFNSGAIVLPLGDANDLYWAYFCHQLGRYVAACSPGLVLLVPFISLKRFLQYQGHLCACALISFICCGCDSLFHYICLWTGLLAKDFVWSAWAFNASMVIGNVLLIVYIAVRRQLCRECWPNGFWQPEVLFEWGFVVVKALRGFVILAFIEWSFIIPTFVAAFKSEQMMVAQTGSLTFCFLTFMVPLGITLGVNVRIVRLFAHLRTDIDTVYTYRVAITFVCLVGVLFWVLFTSLKDILPMAFFDDEDTIAMVAKDMPLIPFTVIFLGVPTLINGAVRWRSTVVINSTLVFIGNYAVGLPLQILFVFWFDMDTFGIWLGMILGYAFTAIIYTIVVAVSSWYKPDVPAPVAESNAPDAQIDYSATDFGPASGHSLLPENERLQEQQALSSAASTTSSSSSAAGGLTTSGLPLIVEPESAPPSERLQGRRKSRFLPTTEEALMLVDCLNPNSARSYEALGNRRESRRVSQVPGTGPQPRRSILVGGGGHRKSLIPPLEEQETRETSLSVSVVEPTYEPLSSATDQNAVQPPLGYVDMPIRRKKRVVIVADSDTAIDVAGYGGSHATADELRRSLATIPEAAAFARSEAEAEGEGEAAGGAPGAAGAPDAQAQAPAQAQPRETFLLILKRVLTVVALLGFFLLGLYVRLCTDIEYISATGDTPVPHNAPLCLVRPTFKLNSTEPKTWQLPEPLIPTRTFKHLATFWS